MAQEQKALTDAGGGAGLAQPSADGAGRVAPPPLPGQPPQPPQAAQPVGQPKPALPSNPEPGIEASPLAQPAQADQFRRRPAKRRPAGPSRERIAANDDAPSIGGLIYALNQKPSGQPFVVAAIASGVWFGLGLGFGWVMIGPEIARAPSIGSLLAAPGLLTAIATILGPILLIWTIAGLMWRAEDMKLRSAAMTEVAIRLSEPDRGAEQQIASLGQAVRRQVSFMNDAVERALGRAGELEALVHNEVSALDRSYEDNERKIRGLIQELAGERHALLSTSDKISDSLRAIGSEVPGLIDKLTNQQLKLARIIEDAGQNLTALETAVATQTGRLEGSLAGRTGELQNVLEGYTTALNQVLGSRAEQFQGLLQGHVEAVGSTLDSGAQTMGVAFDDRRKLLESSLDKRSASLEASLDQRSTALEASLDQRTSAMEESIGERTLGLQVVFEEYAKALDLTLANRAEALDLQLVERTRALDDAFSRRLEMFDQAILQSTMAIDAAVGNSARALTGAMETHARTMSETITKQAVELDETLINGITSVRRTSENITKQSLKAIEGLASQADLLKNVSENLLGQINSVTNRFDNQGQQIMRAANALETANYKIDTTLKTRHADLSNTLERLSGKADDFGRMIEGYSTSIEGSMSDAEKRARRAADEMAQSLSQSADERARATLAEIERLRIATTIETDRALNDLKGKFSHVTREVSEHLGSVTSQFDQTSEEMRQRAARAAAELASEQARLRSQVESIPGATRESTEAMRRALQDQLKALEQLSSLTTREAWRRDVAPPLAPPATFAPGTQPALPPPPRDAQRPMPSLTTTLAQEMALRRTAPQAAATPPAPVAPSVSGGQSPARPAIPDARENWSLGDLLKRASNEETQAAPAAAETAPAGLDIEGLSRALDSNTAAGIWNRFRGGQRGFLVRSIYSESGRAAFDEASRMFRTDPAYRDLVGRFLVDFEAILRTTEARDPTGQAVQAQLLSDLGRVYLLLAHVSGRLN